MNASSQSQPSKTVLITGSGRHRLGCSLAHSLAAAGYRIALHYHQSEAAAAETVAQLKQQGVETVAFQADITQQDQVDRMFGELMDQFGQLDVLVTTAATWEPTPLESVSAEEIRNSFEVNTLGTALCCRAAGLIMAQQSTGGAIITVGDWSVERPYPDHLAYFISKGAIATLTRALAVDFAARNPKVRVNCIQPGPLLFPAGLSEQERQQIIDATLVKQADCPEAFHQTVKFLIENDFVTGVCLPVDGGRTIFPG